MNALRGAIVVVIALVIAVVILARGLDDPETGNEPIEATDTTASADPVPPPPTADQPAPPPPPADDPAPPPPPPPTSQEVELPAAAPDDMFADPPPPPAPTHNRDEVRVLVANGSGVCGAAGRLATSLSAQGYNVLPAVNDDLEGNIEMSTIYYVDQYGADAGVVASLIQMSSSQVLPLGASPPTAPGDAHVLIHLGADDLAQPNC